MKINFNEVNIIDQLDKLIEENLESINEIKSISLTEREIRLFEYHLNVGFESIGGKIFLHSGGRYYDLLSAMKAGFPLQYKGIDLVYN